MVTVDCCFSVKDGDRGVGPKDRREQENGWQRKIGINRRGFWWKHHVEENGPLPGNADGWYIV